MAYVNTRPYTVKGGRIAPPPTSSTRSALTGHADAIIRDVDRRFKAEQRAAERLAAKPEFWTSASGTRPPDPGPRPHLTVKSILAAAREAVAAAPCAPRGALVAAAKKILPPVDPELRARYAALDAAAALSSSSIDPYQTAAHGHLFATSSKKTSFAEKVNLKSAMSNLTFEMQVHQQNQLGLKMGFRR